MSWLARLKKTEIAPSIDATKLGSVGFVASIGVPLQKIEALSPAANDPALEPSTDPNAWRELATAYHLHHFKCCTCITAGRSPEYGLRCGTGAALWNAYQNT